MKHLGIKSNDSDVAEQQDLGGGATTLVAITTIENPTVAGGVFLQEIVPNPGAGKQISIVTLNAVGRDGSAAPSGGNTSLALRYNGSGGNFTGSQLIMAAAGNTYTRTGLGDVSISGDQDNRAVNVAIINTTAQTLTVKIFVRVQYVICDVSTGY